MVDSLSTNPNALLHSRELLSMRDRWGWFLALGISMVALGSFAIGWSCVATLSVTAAWIFGFFLLAIGITEVINAFWIGRWSGLLLHLLLGILYTAVGLMILDQPESAAIQLTLLIAIFLMVTGIVRIVFAVTEQFPGRSWVLLNGGVTLMLGLLIYKQWPLSGLWVIGTFIGIDLIFNGWAWMMLAIVVRRHKPLEAGPVESSPVYN